MYLLLFTIIYCILTHVFNIGAGPAMGIYLIVLGFIKGYVSEELTDVFNLKKTKYLYKKTDLRTP